MILGLTILTFSCKSGGSASEDKPITVKTAIANQYSGYNNAEYPFISQPLRTSELSFRVGGPIDRFEVYPGNHYRRGDIIAEIDTRDFRIRKDRAEAVYKQTKAEYERISSLYSKGNVSASSCEKAEADYMAAKTAYEEACNALEDSHLLAPFDGYASEVFIEKYQDVKPSQPVLTLIDISKIKIQIYVTQEAAIAAQGASEAEITFDALKGKVFTARIVEVSKGTTRNNLSYVVTALLPNEGNQLLAGMSGKARILTGDAGADCEGVVIPVQSLCHRPEIGDFVWVVDSVQGVVNLRKVSSARLLPDGMMHIGKGLDCGEAVATTGLRFLSDGMAVSTENS
ncbi:MAG: efflux RND transporter periplasmic adaptor subunit [Candidatus Cryptobacteroides sp.]